MLLTWVAWGTVVSVGSLRADTPQPCTNPYTGLEAVEASLGFSLELTSAVRPLREIDLSRAKCLPPASVTLPTILEAVQKIPASLPNQARESRQINGIQLEDEFPLLLDLFEKLTTPRDQPLTGEVSITYKTAMGRVTCKKVICALQEIFGERQGPLYLKTLYEKDLNLSPIIWNDAVPWTESELDDVVRGIASLPEGIPISQNPDQTRLVKVAQPTGLGTAVSDEKGIALFPVWSPGSRKDNDSSFRFARMTTVVHELGHQFSRRLGMIDRGSRWTSLSNWVEQPSFKLESGNAAFEWVSPHPERAVTDYALKSPGEDLAESVLAYRAQPDELQKRSPEKYEFIKQVVFGGIEFMSEEQCQSSPVPNYLSQVRKWADHFAKADPILDSHSILTPSVSATVQVQCFDTLFEGFSQKISRKGDIRQCTSERFIQSQMISELPSHPDRAEMERLIEALPLAPPILLAPLIPSDKLSQRVEASFAQVIETTLDELVKKTLHGLHPDYFDSAQNRNVICYSWQTQAPFVLKSKLSFDPSTSQSSGIGTWFYDLCNRATAPSPDGAPWSLARIEAEFRPYRAAHLQKLKESKYQEAKAK